MTRTTRHGFTLIELMIAIVLGSLIIVIAMAGIRVTSQSVTVANRLSIQNSVLRSGIVAANEEMDFWDSFDSRSDPTNRRLRQVGMPFQPLSFNTSTTMLDFDASHPRQWWNGHIWHSTNKRWGDYSYYGKQGFSDPLVPPDRQWHHTILPYTTRNLGYYAAVDYLPANFIYGFYAQNGVMPAEFARINAGPNWFHGNWRNRELPTGKTELGHDMAYILTNVPHARGHPLSHKAVYSSSTAWDDTLFDDWNLHPSSLYVGTMPSHWPQLQLKTRVGYTFSQFRHESIITMTDPLTGDRINITLPALTTTLRGARRQRNLDTEPTNPLYP